MSTKAQPKSDEIHNRLAQAAEKRRSVFFGTSTDVFRLVHGSTDAFPGLVIDVYGSVARIEMYEERWVAHLAKIAAALEGHWPFPTCIVGILRKSQGKIEQIPLLGSAPSGHVVREDGLRYWIRSAEADAAGAGLFADHREGRRLVRHASVGRPVLNLFAHAGGFGVAAMAGGASRVDHVDAAKKCAGWAALNLALNGEDPRRHRFMVDDAFKILKRVARKGPQYGVIICDPPTTAIRPGGQRFVSRDYLPEMSRQASEALLEGGALLLSTNDRSLPVASIVQAAREGAELAGRKVERVVEIQRGPDIPVSDLHHENPMRGVWMLLKRRAQTSDTPPKAHLSKRSKTRVHRVKR